MMDWVGASRDGLDGECGECGIDREFLQYPNEYRFLFRRDEVLRIKPILHDQAPPDARILS